MKHKHRLRVGLILILVTFLLGLSGTVWAEASLAIITQKSSPVNKLSLNDLKSLYLRKTLINSYGVRWVPVNLPVDNQLRQGFSMTLFNQLPANQEQYWNEQYFQGVNPPEVLASEEAVIRFVAITPGAVGYVRKVSVDERVKILSTITITFQNR